MSGVVPAGDDQVGHDRDRAGQKRDDDLDWVAVLLASAAQHAGQHLQRVRSLTGAVAAPVFAIDHDRAYALLGSPVRGLDAGDDEEGEQRVALDAQMFNQLAVRLAAGRLGGQQQVETLSELQDPSGQLLGFDAAGVAGVAQRQASLRIRWTVWGMWVWPQAVSAIMSWQRRSRCA